MSAHPFALEQNLALMAGAGSGKTHSLLTLCLHLLGGATRDPIRPSELCILTFTDKAAAELRERLRRRLDGLCRPEGMEHEPELRESFASASRSPPSADEWRKIRDDLGGATIGTFHSFCVQLLRRAPAGFGVDPAFSLLEEREAQTLVNDVAQRLVLEALERPGNDALVALCRELGFLARGRALGLVDLLCQVHQKVREEGLDPASIRVTDAEPARRGFDDAVGNARRALARARSLDRSGKFLDVLPPVADCLDKLTLETFLSDSGYPRMVALLGSDTRLKRQRDELGATLKELCATVLGQEKPRAFGLLQHFAQTRAVAYEGALRQLLSELHARHRTALDERRALDFSELLIRSRDLLRDQLAVRAEVHTRMGALLVDEFQDTNRLQLELCCLLAERRAGGPRPIDATNDAVSLPLEPRMLCAVGDRKQSIYEFRGADVSVFGLLAEKIEREGGSRAYLRRNWRSSPELLSFFNPLFAALLAPREGRRDYEVAYDREGDDLAPVRESLLGPNAVDRIVFDPLETAEESRALEADLLARRIKELLGDAAPETVVEKGKARRAVGGDIAVLFRRFSHLEVYRQALTRHRVPHRIVRGRGFYGAQEVLDLAQLLALIADPSDAIALAALLRSPIIAVSDATLFQLAYEAQKRLTLDELTRVNRYNLPPSEGERLERFLQLFPKLRRERDRLGVRGLIRVAVEETGYRVTLAAIPFGEQALANVDKLLELAADWDERGRGDAASFSRELLALADLDPMEAQAEVLDVGDPRAVTLMTIHQSKGLEWPIVAVPDLAQTRGGRFGDRIAFDRRLGLAIRPWVDEVREWVASPRHAEVCGEVRRRDFAESLRLLYVALTRAKDRLILSGQAMRQQGSWRHLLDTEISLQADLRARVRDISADELVSQRVDRPSPPSQATAFAALDEVLGRVRSVSPVRPKTAVLPVTHLQDYVRCPRRYFYAHQVGLSEFPLVFDVEPDEGDDAPSGKSAQDRRFRGTLAHALLEKVDLSLDPSAMRSELEQLLWAEGVSPTDVQGKEIIGWVEGFLATRFADKMRSAPERVHREMPFLVRLGSPEMGFVLHLKGQIDVLVEDDDGGATVLDYKASQRHPEGLAAYAFQLDCYAFAARRMLRPGVPIRTGIAFLKEPRLEPELRSDAALAFEDLERRLLEQASELVRATRDMEWPGLPRSKCEALRCGYQYRCHSSAGRL